MKPPADPLDILVVAPHPDDAELSVGGTILRSRKEGLRVGVLELTSGEPTPRGSLETRAREMSGRLHLDSKPARGCQVTVTFSLGPMRS